MICCNDDIIAIPKVVVVRHLLLDPVRLDPVEQEGEPGVQAPVDVRVLIDLFRIISKQRTLVVKLETISS